MRQLIAKVAIVVMLTMFPSYIIYKFAERDTDEDQFVPCANIPFQPFINVPLLTHPLLTNKIYQSGEFIYLLMDFNPGNKKKGAVGLLIKNYEIVNSEDDFVAMETPWGTMWWHGVVENNDGNIGWHVTPRDRICPVEVE